MKKIFLLFVLITAGATAQEKFTIGGGGVGGSVVAGLLAAFDYFGW